MDIVHLVEKKVLSVTAKILEVLGDGMSYLSFERALKKELDSLGCEILGTVLQALEEEIYRSDDRKRNWKIVRKNDPKEILTPFGNLVFERRYYQNKVSGEYTYLVDKRVGITPHMRVGPNFKASLTEVAGVNSYETTTKHMSRYNQETKVSKQTVANCIKEFKSRQAPKPAQKRRVEELYIEADEDHVKVKGRKGAQARLIYVHEGIGEYPRRHLNRARYFTTVGKTSEEFWLDVCDYIAANYDLSSIKSIYISGDGGGWIKTGKECIPGAIFVLDRFHLAKYILRATAHVPSFKAPIYKAIQVLDQQAVLTKLEEALILAEKPARQKRIRDTIKYFKNNWNGISAQVKYPHVGCSAEGHVSHVLSARLSSRPMAWSLKGAGNMAGIRAVMANGERVSEHYIASVGETQELTELNQKVKRELMRVKERMLGKESINNVPLFNGKRNLTHTALKGLNEQLVI